MTIRLTKSAAVCCVVLSLCAAQSHAETPGWEMGVRPSVLIDSKVPADDIVGYGIALRYERHNDWSVGFGLDQSSFDLATSQPITESSPLPYISVDSTILSVWLERRHGDADPGGSWFWTAGFGYAFLNTGNSQAAGTSQLSGPVVVDASDELQFHGSVGLRWRFANKWAIEAAALVQHHMSEFLLTDISSGSTTRIGSHSPVGFNLGVSYRFE